jgi:DNA polymerase-3 subunit epsilon
VVCFFCLKGFLMKVNCPSCTIAIAGTKSAMGTRVSCPDCRHAFYWTDRWHAGESFVIYDLEPTFASFAKPRRPISSFIESYTGVGNRHVANAKRPEEVLCEFAAWAGDATLVAHNGLRFDSKFLSATCRRHGLPAREVHSIDTIHISKMLFGKTRGTGHSLDHLISRLRIDQSGIRRHDARGDVEILGHAVSGMWQRLQLDRAFNGVPRHNTLLPV